MEVQARHQEKKEQIPKDEDELITEIDCLEVLEPQSLKVFLRPVRQTLAEMQLVLPQGR